MVAPGGPTKEVAVRTTLTILLFAMASTSRAALHPVEPEIPQALRELTFEDYKAAAQASDSDGDGLSNFVDNCGSTFNPEQEDADADGVGDICDLCPHSPAPGYVDGCLED
jgi:Thrombospondin type 3 repeat